MSVSKLRFAVMGFRHGHVYDACHRIKGRADAEIVAACEEDAVTRDKIRAEGRVILTHDSYASMLDSVPVDAVLVGDYYAKRGSVILEALRRGKHVLSDKPFCTCKDELNAIQTISRQNKLVVGCMLDLRDQGVALEMRRMILNGAIGEIHAISFNGEHPLLHGTRPAWYFEEGKHGGTLNDIAIHAMDVIPWMTGLHFLTIQVARHWNARLKEASHFKDCAQVMLTMDNQCGVLGDVSYLAPDNHGYALPQYWQMRFWGSDGLLENHNFQEILLYHKNAKEVKSIAHPEGRPGGYLDAFIREVRGENAGLHLSSAECFRAQHLALAIQDAADRCLTRVQLA